MTDKKSLYHLTAEEVILIDELEGLLEPEPDPETGEIPDSGERLAALIQHQTATAEKIDQVIRIIDVFSHRAALAKADFESKREIIERSRDSAKRSENAVSRLKRSIVEYMVDTGKDEMLSAAGAALRVQNNPHSAEVPTDARISDWDEEFYRIDWLAQKKAIITAFKEGRDIPAGVEVVQTKRLVIK